MPSSNYARSRRVVAASFALFAVVACDDDYGPSEPETQAPASAAVTQARPKVISKSGDITGALADFRAILGDPLNGATPGEQPAGRREINWDGVPAPFLNDNPFPGDFFNVNSPRGSVYTTEGDLFRVSDNDFGDLNATYDAQFNVFSPNKTFTATGARTMEVHFRVAGTTTPAVVTGFGVVFSDIDRRGSTTIELFDSFGANLGRYIAPARSDATGLSFLGIDFGTPIIAKARIRVGDRRIGDELDVSDGGKFDLVVMDDFLYGEPRAVETM